LLLLCLRQVYLWGFYFIIGCLTGTICSVVTCEGGIYPCLIIPLPSQNPRSPGTSPLGLTSLKRKNHPIVVTLGGIGSCYTSLTFKTQALILATNCAITSMTIDITMVIVVAWILVLMCSGCCLVTLSFPLFLFSTLNKVWEDVMLQFDFSFSGSFFGSYSLNFLLELVFELELPNFLKGPNLLSRVDISIAILWETLETFASGFVNLSSNSSLGYLLYLSSMGRV
jgi:hypothetical protein